MTENFPSLFQCPACRQPLSFAHPHTNLVACTCGTAVCRHEKAGLISTDYQLVPFAFDTIRPGAYGTWNGRNFKVAGRFRAWSDDAVINYWTLLFEEGGLAWLQEGYGLYAVLEETKIENMVTTATFDKAGLGSFINLYPMSNYRLDKVSRAFRLEVEGEVYLPGCPAGFRLQEYAPADGNHLALFEFSRDVILPFTVSYTTFSGLHLAHTRSYDNPGTTFTCGQCNQPVEVKTYPFAISCACPHCGSGYSFHRGDPKRQSAPGPPGEVPGIPLFSSGTVKGITYEVVGFAIKAEKASPHARWREYTLFHPQEGYAFLSEYEGHWIYAREKGNHPVLPNKSVDSFEFNREPFRLFNAYRYKPVQVQGEFPYDIFAQAGTHVKEYISPPEMWIQEWSKDGITWFLGEHVSPFEMARNFSFPGGLPGKTGIGAVEPKGYIPAERIAGITLLFLISLLAVHLLIGEGKTNRLLLDKTYRFENPTDPALSVMAGTYTLEKWRSNIRIEVQAPVSNSWLELEASLTSTSTGTEFTLEDGVEYYDGYEDGVHWSEGSPRTSAWFSQVPAGTYVLLLRAERDAMSYNRPGEVSVSVTYDVPDHRNLVIGIVALLIWPVIHYFRIRQQEKDRWYHSPYSPYTYET